MPCASEAALADMAVPVLYPADVQDVLDLGRHAVHLSRISGCWVGLKMVTAVADGSGTATVAPDRVVPVMPDVTIDGKPFHHEPHAKLLGPRLAPLERDLHRARLVIARRYAAANGLNTILGQGPARVGIVAAGKSWPDLRQALATLGLDDAELAARGVRLLRVGMPWPLEPGIVDHFADGLDEIIVVEEKRAFLETQIKERLYGRAGAPAVHGKTGPDGAPLFAVHGDLDPDAVATGLARRLSTGPGRSSRAWSRGTSAAVPAAPGSTCRSRAPTARRSSARGARTTPRRPRRPRARSSARASAATPWSCSCRRGRSVTSPG